MEKNNSSRKRRRRGVGSRGILNSYDRKRSTCQRSITIAIRVVKSRNIELKGGKIKRIRSLSWEKSNTIGIRVGKLKSFTFKSWRKQELKK